MPTSKIFHVVESCARYFSNTLIMYFADLSKSPPCKSFAYLRTAKTDANSFIAYVLILLRGEKAGYSSNKSDNRGIL